MLDADLHATAALEIYDRVREQDADGVAALLEMALSMGWPPAQIRHLLEWPGFCTRIEAWTLASAICRGPREAWGWRLCGYFRAHTMTRLGFSIVWQSVLRRDDFKRVMCPGWEDGQRCWRSAITDHEHCAGRRGLIIPALSVSDILERRLLCDCDTPQHCHCRRRGAATDPDPGVIPAVINALCESLEATP